MFAAVGICLIVIALGDRRALASVPTPKRVSNSKLFPALLILFVGSGCSALIYEIVWFQLLQLAIGSTAISLGVLLGSFMGGMCLGSLALPKFVSGNRHPLKVYAALELGIGLCGLLLLFVLPTAGGLYTAIASPGPGGIALRALVCALCLLPPTLLMGATLPVIARWVESTPTGISRLGFFYGANIAGAVLGCLLAGFYLLRVFDLAVATYVAVAINLLVAALGLALASLSRDREGAVAGRSDNRLLPRAAPGPVYIAIMLSGLCALGAEVIWTRILSLMLGATVYTFSIILAVFLIGLGIGSALGSAAGRSLRSPAIGLGFCQLALTAAIAWSGYALGASLPYWPIDSSLTADPWIGFQLDFVRCAWAALPAACLWGASFPLALAAASAPGQDTGLLAGRIYAANTLGAIIGAVGVSAVAIPGLGTQGSQQVLIVLAAIAGLLVLATKVRPVILAGSLVAVGICAQIVPQIPPGLVAYGGYLPTYETLPAFLYVGEGMNASIAVSEDPDGWREFHVSGKVVASSQDKDMGLQRMLGHLPALMLDGPKSVLIVGCGAGVTAGTFALYPSIERIVICEIEPLIPPAADEYFSDENYGIVHDPRVEIIYDDARHFLATTDEKFDIITSDPIHPWVKGAATLYSEEYFELTKQRLTERGVVTQWVPMYESNEAAVKSQVATFMAAFPHGSIWANDNNGEGYDLVLLAEDGPGKVDLDALQARLDRPDHAKVLDSLSDVDMGSGMSLLSTFAGYGPDLKDYLADADINRDINLRLQYLAGLGLNSFEADRILRSIVAHRKYPKELIVAAEDDAKELERRFNQPLPELDPESWWW